MKGGKKGQYRVNLTAEAGVVCHTISFKHASEDLGSKIIKMQCSLEPYILYPNNKIAAKL